MALALVLVIVVVGILVVGTVALVVTRRPDRGPALEPPPRPQAVAESGTTAVEAPPEPELTPDQIAEQERAMAEPEPEPEAAPAPEPEPEPVAPVKPRFRDR